LSQLLLRYTLLFRRLGVCASEVSPEDSFAQIDLFTDYKAKELEHRLQGALLDMRSRFGSNCVFTGNNLLEGATMLERNQQIGGHKA